MANGSPSGFLNADELLKVGKGLLIAASGAAITYIASWVSDTDFGVWTPTVTAGAAVVVNFLRKWLTDNS